MKRELDIRPLIVNHLKHNEQGYNYKIKSLLNEEKYCIRPFNEGYTWTRKKATYFIESLILGCEVHPLIVFENEDKCYICDGLNRYLTIKKFVNNELSLEGMGLTKLKWLAGKKFKDLKEKEQNYFLNNIYMSTVIYSYENTDNLVDNIDEDGILAIQKQLYVRYNSGIRLATEELQKAQFQGEYLTELFNEKLQKDEKYKMNLKSLYIGKRNQKRNEIECMLVDIRYLIASTYSNIRAYCNCRDKNQRINIFYEEQLCWKSEEEKNQMYHDFNICMDVLLKVLNLPEWNQYEILHNKYFIQSLYWGISVLQRERAYPLSRIDLRTLIKYFGKNEEEYHKFVSSEAHHNKLMIERYLEIAKYFKKYYGQDLTKEFDREMETPEIDESMQKIDVQQVHYRRAPHTMTVAEMLDDLRTFRYNVHPKYQRLESNNIVGAARIIESMLVDIQIPPILTFQKQVDGDIVFEVIDGQQRLLSLVAYTNSIYKNENGEECHSEKEGYALTGLDILYELNGTTFSLTKNRHLLDEEKKKKIMNTTLYFVNIIEDDEKEARDHFVRLNSNITPLHHNFFYWNAIGDQRILDQISILAHSHHERILGNNNVQMVSEKYITTLSCLIYNLHQVDYQLRSNFQLSRVTHWLQDFNKLKQNCFNKNEERINEERTIYMNAVNALEQFLIKMELWLDFITMDIKDIFHIKSNTRIAIKNLVCLVQLLEHIPLEDMKKHAKEIEDILTEFYDNLHKREVDVKQEEQFLFMARERINFLDSSIDADVHEHMKQVL